VYTAPTPYHGFVFENVQLTYNGNKSSIHWDMVTIRRPEWGGGEIWFDGVLIRKDGLFVIPQLECLNPEQLKA